MSGRLTSLRTVGHGLLFTAGLGIIVSSLAQAQTGAAATVSSLSGQVSVLRDNAPWALKAGDSVLPKQIIVTGPDGIAELKVADGSHFQVFPNSRVVFRDNPGNWRDLLDISIGAVKVFIRKLGNQPNPNSVHTPTAVIAVRGTVFEVFVDEETTTSVSVDEGQVEVRHLTVMGPSRLLNAGESVTVYRNVPLAKAVDKGSVLHGALRAAAQALQEVLYRTSRPGGGSGSGGTGGGATPPPVQGDKDKDAPPTTLPPPPPPM